MEIAALYDLFKQSTGITTDTRNIKPGNIFFALKGSNFNGNTFAAQALSQGAAHAVVDEMMAQNEKIHKVENALETLQQLALYHRQQFSGKVISLTGSNGKTTTKELIAAVLATTYKIQATKGNFNNHIGIPLTLLSMPTDLDFAIIEMGANHQQEIDSYCHYTHPDFGLITNVGMAHLEGFGGFEGVVKGKTELYRFLAQRTSKIFINTDNEILMQKAAEAGLDENRLITYGTANAFCTATLLKSEFLGLEVDGYHIHTKLVGSYNFENVLAACCIGKYFGIDMSNITTALESYTPSNNRSQQIKKNTNTIILDCYNANPTSMKAALENFAATDATQKIAIFGGMKEVGTSSEEEHRKIAQMALSYHFHKTIFIGEEFKFVQPPVLHFQNTDDASEWVSKQAIENSLILVKGSRSYSLEKLFE